jgi:hypothetical protein
VRNGRWPLTEEVQERPEDGTVPYRHDVIGDHGPVVEDADTNQRLLCVVELPEEEASDDDQA